MGILCPGCTHEGGVGEGFGVCVVQHLGHTGPDGNARPPTPLSKSLMEHLWAPLPSHTQNANTNTHRHKGKRSGTRNALLLLPLIVLAAKHTLKCLLMSHKRANSAACFVIQPISLSFSLHCFNTSQLFTSLFVL